MILLTAGAIMLGVIFAAVWSAWMIIDLGVAIFRWLRR